MAEENMDVQDETLDKKAAKKAEKERRKQEKKKAKEEKKLESDSLEEETETSGGNKVAIFFVTLIIVVIWLAILTLLVKWDVGGFGSTVLTPLLKDVPYINKILPESSEEMSTEDTEYGYATLDDAIARIKELEVELADAQSQSTQSSDYVSQLESQVAELQQYKQDEADFEAEKQKFYEEVVFSDNAPDIQEYKNYYESIDPANAEVLYKQVVSQVQADEQLQDYVKTYSSMKPKEAAAIFDTMTDNLQLVADILMQMDASARGDILGKMNSDTAAKVTEIMQPSE
ncbi:MotE family protein [Roseburia sp. 831b]|uniref:MotE family protein n=1 Tax=Roseburia sp. 831b TaxID=1261635 RepID=UPI0009536063|nr:hypothetical protein [Roseburia sp. 831b]WVK73843.1 hypothetical protein BIV16_04815 [Roseburia sp. 831b]